MHTAGSILELIGKTPVVKLNKLVPAGNAEVYVKLEYLNPGGSVKDRAAQSMIETAEASGSLQPGGTIIEPTSGNTGIGLAMVAAAKGYRCIITMPENASKERIQLMRAYGARVVLTPRKGKMQGAIDRARMFVSEIKNSFIPDQFSNPANPDIHRKTTAIEILRQMDKHLDAFVATAGTGGTISGTGEVLKRELPALKIYTVEAKDSPVLAGGQQGEKSIPGTGPGFIPKNLNREIYDRVYHISDEEMKETMKDLARKEGLLLGPSSAAAVWTALQVARDMLSGQRVLAIAADSGQRYLSGSYYK